MGGSKSAQTSQTTQIDNRRVIGEGGLSAEGSNVNITNSSLDADVAKTAILASTTDLQTALNHSTTSTGLSFDFGKKALDFAGAETGRAFDFSSLLAGKAFDFASESNEKAAQQLDATSNLVKDAYADAKGRGALTDQILIGAIVMAGLVAFAAVKGN